MRHAARIVLTCLLLSGCPAEEASNPAPPNGTDADGGSDHGTDASGGTDTPDATTSGDATDEDTAVEKPPCTVGLPCDDKDPCTIDDECVAQVCQGTPYACDDGRPCTDNECDGVGGCEFPVHQGFCLVGNVCTEHGTLNAANTCERCDTDLNKIGWSKQADLEACEDGNPCTFGDYCKKGICKKGLKATCEDENDCTLDECEPLIGCLNTPISGPCNDGDKCTVSSVCSGGVCHSPVAQCDDGNPCTTDTCLPDLGCEHVVIEGECEDGDACTTGDHCQDGACVSGPTDPCDDGTECTIDLCDPVFGCYQTLTGDPCCSGAVHVCDDEDPCTTDSCAPGGGCLNTPNTGPCEDGDPCTAPDSCAGGACKSGPPNPCDDGNPCTSDSCSEASGCQHSPKLGGCNDGIACTTADTCIDGVCVGDTAGCKCDPVFSTFVAKAVKLDIGLDGHPGNGVDVDGKASTCSPADKCSGGVDNSLAPLASFVNSNIEKEVAKGGLILLLEFKNPKTDGSPFTVALMAGKKKSGSCDHQKPGCEYLADGDTLDEDCSPLVVLDNAKIVGGKLTAGGPGYSFSLLIPLFGDTLLEVKLANGRIEADVTLSGDQITSMKGVVGGAVSKSTFVTAIEFVPESDLPAPKETVVQLIDILIINDIDTGPPTGADAASVGLRIEGVSGTIVGVD